MFINPCSSPATGNLQLADRIYYSFCPQGANQLVYADIASFFPTQEEARFAFSMFDKDDNGDVTLEEVEQSCQCV